MLLDLEALGQTPLGFALDRGKLYVHGQFGEIYSWNLQLIRHHLTPFQLDWAK